MMDILQFLENVCIIHDLLEWHCVSISYLITRPVPDRMMNFFIISGMILTRFEMIWH